MMEQNPGKFFGAASAARWLAIGLLVGWCATALPRSAVAEESELQSFDIPAGELAPALQAYIAQSHQQLIYRTDEVQGLRTHGVSGSLTAEEALRQLLSDTSLSVRREPSGAILVTRGTPQRGASESKVGAPPIRRQNNGAAAAPARRAPAGDDARETRRTMEEIIVTAQKRAETLMEVPISIVALGEKELEARRIEDIEDLGLAVPGLSVSDGGNFGRRIFMRGVGNIAGSASLIGIYIDEMPLSTNPVFEFDVRPHDLARVEVLRGPQGTLYGQGSVGGTIRYITNDPDLEEFSVGGGLAASFTKDGAPSQRVRSVLNAPFLDGLFALRLSGLFEHNGGWMDQPAASQKDINDENVTNARAKALWQPSERLHLIASATLHRNDAGAAPMGEDENGNYTQTFNLLTTPSSEDDYELYNLTFSYDFGAISLLASSGYVDTRKLVDQQAGVFPLLPPPVPAFDILQKEDISSNVFSQEIRLSSNGEGGLQWLLGGFYEDSEFDRTSSFRFGFRDGPLPDPITVIANQGSKSWAAFGNASLQVADRVKIGAGLRYFEDDREADDGFSVQHKTFDSLDPRVFVNVDITEEAMVYVSVSKGFRSGGFNQLGSPPFDPESLWTYELGAKASFLGGRLQAELAGFFSDYKNYVVIGIPPPPATPVSIQSNAGNAEIKGLEWTITGWPTERLSLNFAGNFVNAEFVEVNAVTASHQVGDDLDFIPDHQLTLSANYDFLWHDRPGFVRLDYNQKGRSSLRNRTTGPHYFSESDLIDMLNFNLRWNWKDSVSIGLFARNLLNDRGYADPFSILQIAARSRPRSFGFEVDFDF